MSADASDPQSAPGRALAGEPTVTYTAAVEAPGAVIGPYKLLQQIGEGGFGVVYMAEQEQPVRRTVALKIIKPGMDSREVIARFEAERQALALMDHQHIARVLDAGTTDSGRPFFVMELVWGVPIQPQRPLPGCQHAQSVNSPVGRRCGVRTVRLASDGGIKRGTGLAAAPGIFGGQHDAGSSGGS